MMKRKNYLSKESGFDAYNRFVDDKFESKLQYFRGTHCFSWDFSSKKA